MKQLLLFTISLLASFSLSRASDIFVNKSDEVQKYTGSSAADEFRYFNTILRTEGHYKKQWDMVSYDLVSQKRTVLRTLCHAKPQSSEILPITYQPYTFLWLNEKAYLVYTQIEKKSKFYALHIQEISTTGESIGALREISRVPMPDVDKKDWFNIRTTFDNKQVMIWNNSDSKTDNGNTIIKFRIFDADFSVLKNGIITAPMGTSFPTITFIDAQRILMKGFRAMTGTTPGWDYIVGMYNIDTERLTKYVTSFPNTDIYSITAPMNKELTKIYIGGLTKNIKKNVFDNQFIDGAFSTIIDLQTNEISEISYNKFSREFINLIVEDPIHKKAKEDDGIFPLTVFKDAIIHPDGRFTILYESFIRHDVSLDRNHPRSTEYFKDIIAICISPKGQISKVATLDKLQTDTHENNDTFSSFETLTKDGKIYVIYGENKEDNNRKNTDFKKSSLYYSILDSDGNFSQPKLLMSPTDGFAFAPLYTIYNNRVDLFIPFIDTGFSDKEHYNWNYKTQYAHITIK